jgi:hypothetical protein
MQCCSSAWEQQNQKYENKLTHSVRPQFSSKNILQSKVRLSAASFWWISKTKNYLFPSHLLYLWRRPGNTIKDIVLMLIWNTSHCWSSNFWVPAVAPKSRRNELQRQRYCFDYSAFSDEARTFTNCFALQSFNQPHYIFLTKKKAIGLSSYEKNHCTQECMKQNPINV